MKGLKIALSQLTAVDFTARAKRSFARQTEVEKALVRLDAVVAQRLEFAEPIGKFQARVLQAFVNGDIDSIPRRDVRRIPWALWGGEQPLSDHPALVAAYAVRLRHEKRTSWYSTLRHAYFQSFRPKLALADQVLTLLREGQQLPNWRWSEQSQQLKLFERAGVSETLISSFSISVPAIVVLENAGFQLGLENSSYVGYAFRELCGRVDCEEAAAEKWLWDFFQDQGSIRFPEHSDAFVEAVLSPWDTAQPPQERRSALIERLLRLFGDPRINRARWKGIPEKRVQQFIGLLTRDSIEMFLDIVGDNALDHQWKYRRAFWMSYLNAGVITDAWVLFGPRAFEDARRALKETRAAERFARLNRPSSSDHSVLLLKLGDLTIAEFSHNGRVWIWSPSEAKLAPRLYRSSYTISEVTGAEIGFVHAGSDSFHWQTNVAEVIRKYTRIKAIASEWKPRA